MSPLGKSDHCIICFDCLFGTDTTIHSNKLNFNKGNYDELRLRNFIKEDWDSTFIEIENVEEMYCYLKNKIVNGMNSLYQIMFIELTINNLINYSHLITISRH